MECYLLSEFCSTGYVLSVHPKVSNKYGNCFLTYTWNPHPI